MPESDFGVCFIGFSIGETHELALHSPGGEEVNPPLSRTRSLAGYRFSEHTDSVCSEMSNCGVQVVDIKTEVVASDVGVFGLWQLVVGCFPLEDLEIGTEFAAKEPQFPHHGSRVDIHLLSHPVAVSDEGAHAVDAFAANDVNEESFRLIEVRNGKSDVFGTPQSRQAHNHTPLRWSPSLSERLVGSRIATSGIVTGSQMSRPPSGLVVR